MEGMSVELRVRLSAADVHYGGNLVDGAHGLELFGDIVTELAIRTDGDEGLFAGYESVEFLAPLYGGDFVRVTGTIVRMGNTSRTVDLEIWKQISARPDVSESAADVLDPPVLATRARGTYVVKREHSAGRGARGRRSEGAGREARVSQLTSTRIAKWPAARPTESIDIPGVRQLAGRRRARPNDIHSSCQVAGRAPHTGQLAVAPAARPSSRPRASRSRAARAPEPR